MRRFHFALFVMISFVVMLPAISSAATCSICQKKTSTWSFDPNAPAYTVAYCIVSSKGDIQNCQVIAVDQYTQTCTAVNYVSSPDCYGIDVFQPSDGGTVWTRQVDSARHAALITLINLRRGI